MKRGNKTIARFGFLAVTALVLFGSNALAVFGQMGNLKQAEQAFAAASVIVLGRDIKNEDYTMVSDIGSKNPKLRDEILNEGINFVTAVKILKIALAETERSALRTDVIERAYREVYGRKPTAVEQAKSDAAMRAQKSWFAVLKSSLVEQLKANAFEREAVIKQVYFQTMGRTASKDEIARWQNRYETYTQMIAANRQYLYSADGASDLVATIRRVLTGSNGRPPSEEMVKSYMTKFAKDRAIFIEMKK